jgi:hypothetical protein
MMSVALFFLPLVASVQPSAQRADVETLTLTSGLTIEARYLPEQDSYLLSLEAFGAVTADLELAGPSCTTRIKAVEAECQLALDDVLKRAEHRQADLYDAWVEGTKTIAQLEDKLRDTDDERIMWRWFSFGLGAVAFSTTSFLILTR